MNKTVDCSISFHSVCKCKKLRKHKKFRNYRNSRDQKLGCQNVFLRESLAFIFFRLQISIEEKTLDDHGLKPWKITGMITCCMLHVFTTSQTHCPNVLPYKST